MLPTNIFTEQFVIRSKKMEKYRDRYRFGSGWIFLAILIIFVVLFYFTIHYLIKLGEFDAGDSSSAIHSLESIIMEGMPPNELHQPTSTPTIFHRTPRLRKIERHISQPHNRLHQYDMPIHI